MRVIRCVFRTLYALGPVLVAAGKLSTTTSAAAASSSVIPPAANVTIKKVSTSGSGCPKNDVTVSVSLDRSTVTLGFDEFDAYIGPGTTKSQHHKQCQIHLALRYPPGYTFAVFDATYHGFAQLDEGVTGTVQSTYQFLNGKTYIPEASLANTSTTVTLDGGGAYAAGQEYVIDDQISVLERVRAPCGKVVDLLVDTRIALTSTDPNAEGILTDDDATFSFGQDFQFGWQACSPTS